MKEITPEELRALMDQPGDPSFRLIDVREQDEFDICKLDHAELLPLSSFAETALKRLTGEKRPIILYCHHGMRSGNATRWLMQKGFDNVINLTGGIDAWALTVEPTMTRY